MARVARHGRIGGDLGARTARFLFAISPFATLERLAYLAQTQTYPLTFDWLYLFLALSIVIMSRVRQRKSFFYARDLLAGDVLSNDNVKMMRPGTGITGDREQEIIGKSLAADVRCDSMVSLEDLADD